MPYVVGIDEAGYGPVLGPLVIGATLWRVPADAVGANLWLRLRGAVRRATERGESRVAVDDSKRVYVREKGLHTLERTVLAFARALDLPCGSVAELLGQLGAHEAASSSVFPWYRDLGRSLPVDPARSACEGAALRLRTKCAEKECACRGLAAQVIPEDLFNARLAQTHNKANVEIEAVLRLFDWALRRCGADEVHFFVDRLGGRANYRDLLLSAFGARHLHELAVDETCSRYRLESPAPADGAPRPGDWHFEFKVEADRTHLPVALASMVAKYVRELLMDQFNAYWRGRAPQVQPTAGYRNDAWRFLDDIRPLLGADAPPLAPFVRAR